MTSPLGEPVVRPDLDAAMGPAKPGRIGEHEHWPGTQYGPIVGSAATHFSSAF